MRIIYPLIRTSPVLYRNTPPLMIIKPDVYLLGSILLETTATCCLKKTLVNKNWYFPVYLGYGISFWTFPKSLSKYSLSTAYVIWSGCGVILTTIFDNLLYKEIITFRKILSSLIILFGIILSK